MANGSNRIRHKSVVRSGLVEGVAFNIATSKPMKVGMQELDHNRGNGSIGSHVS